MKRHRVLSLVHLSSALFLVHGGACSNLEAPYNEVDIQKAGQLQAGTSLVDVQSALGSQGGFGFLVRSEAGEQLGIEYCVGSWYAPMLFMFENNTLKSVVPVPRRKTAVRLREDQTRESKAIPRNPNEAMRDLLHHKSYIGQELIDYAKERKPSDKIKIPNNLIPAIGACIVCPGILVVAIGDELDRPRVLKDREQARREWSYQRVGLGMEQRDVELIFGKPSLEQTTGRLRGCVYGDRRRGAEIAVEFYDGHVRSMFGPRFRPFDWTGDRRQALFEDGYQPRKP